MELELGLSLPVSPHFSTKTFDLNIPEEQRRPCINKDISLLKNADAGMEFKNLMMVSQKRSFEEAFDEEDDESKTLSLLVWSGRQPSDDQEDHGPNGLYNRKNFDPFGKSDEEDNQIVGWPPIKSWRKKLLHGVLPEDRAAEAERENLNGARNSMFVKVKMEGVIIGRKIDLTLFDSYQALADTLLDMFAKYRNGDKNDGPYILSYLDKDGDWLIAGDVPWQIFIESVQRMEILKRSS